MTTSADDSPMVLAQGELHVRRRFGPGVISRGAVLYECDWDGGRFESGVILGGIFRAGTFAGGRFVGGIFAGGDWTGGEWECGFDGEGRYRPRSNHP